MERHAAEAWPAGIGLGAHARGEERAEQDIVGKIFKKPTQLGQIHGKPHAASRAAKGKRLHANQHAIMSSPRAGMQKKRPKSAPLLSVCGGVSVVRGGSVAHRMQRHPSKQLRATAGGGDMGSGREGGETRGGGGAGRLTKRAATSNVADLEHVCLSTFPCVPLFAPRATFVLYHIGLFMLYYIIILALRPATCYVTGWMRQHFLSFFG